MSYHIAQEMALRTASLYMLYSDEVVCWVLNSTISHI